ncbi:Protein of unknown function [Nannocystis exedens]|uniref:Uncharacterized protein n=1 Tax=Nannocystis exedens TaxID=54 RepID=A0A1I1YAN4_9BACT|nr:DUF4241 domain-containing protein [Nannocystis exedens]PCC71835.1 hypothetical protein NAEX_04914 [Nannocystis exedens]SFE14960.1 Protein of unknown function [Nannocystis exedens]
MTARTLPPIAVLYRYTDIPTLERVARALGIADPHVGAPRYFVVAGDDFDPAGLERGPTPKNARTQQRLASAFDAFLWEEFVTARLGFAARPDAAHDVARGAPTSRSYEDVRRAFDAGGRAVLEWARFREAARRPRPPAASAELLRRARALAAAAHPEREEMPRLATHVDSWNDDDHEALRLLVKAGQAWRLCYWESSMFCGDVDDFFAIVAAMERAGASSRDVVRFVAQSCLEDVSAPVQLYLLERAAELGAWLEQAGVLAAKEDAWVIPPIVTKLAALPVEEALAEKRDAMVDRFLDEHAARLVPGALAALREADEDRFAAYTKRAKKARPVEAPSRDADEDMETEDLSASQREALASLVIPGFGLHFLEQIAQTRRHEGATALNAIVTLMRLLRGRPTTLDEVRAAWAQVGLAPPEDTTFRGYERASRSDEGFSSRLLGFAERHRGAIHDGCYAPVLSNPAEAAVADAEEAEQSRARRDHARVIADVVTLGKNHPQVQAVRLAGKLVVSSGRIVACDPCIRSGAPAFEREIPRGTHPVRVFVTKGSRRIGLALLACSDAPVASWVMATRPGQSLADLQEGHYFGYPVDTGLGCFMDAVAAELLREAEDALDDESFYDAVLDDALEENDQLFADVRPAKRHKDNVIVFRSGGGDGVYASYWGLAADGEVACLVTDFNLFDPAQSEEEKRAQLLATWGPWLERVSAVLGESLRRLDFAEPIRSVELEDDSATLALTFERGDVSVRAEQSLRGERPIGFGVGVRRKQAERGFDSLAEAAGVPPAETRGDDREASLAALDTLLLRHGPVLFAPETLARAFKKR